MRGDIFLAEARRSLTTLSLYSNALTGAIPAELGSLTKLETLYLGDNQLSGAVVASATGVQLTPMS